MAFRIHKGIFQSKNASNVYENKFKIDDESGALIAVDAQGAQTGAFLRTTDVATDSNLLDGLDSSSFLRSDADDSTSGYFRINKNWGGGDYGAEAFTIRGTSPSITFRNTTSNDKWLFHIDSGSIRYYYGGGVDSNSWGEKFKIANDGNVWSAYYSDWYSNVFWRKNTWEGNVLLHTDGRIYGTIFYDSNNSAYYLDPNGTSNLYNVSTNSTSARYFTQGANGEPSNNLGSPTVTEMALFNEQFNNKTAFLDPTRVTVWKQPFDGEAWEDITASYGETSIRRFIAGYDSSANIYIPNGVFKFRIEVTHPNYVFANAVYFYWSSNSHSTKLHLWARRTDNNAWYQRTSSDTNVSSWPGHLYMPFSSIPWHPSANSSGHYNTLRFEFTPNWSTGTYADRNIDLYKMQVWGGYPAGTRYPYSVNEYGDFTAIRNLSGSTLYEGGTSLVSKYLGIGSKAADSNLLDGLDSSAFVQKNVGYEWTAVGVNALTFRSNNTIESSSGDQAALEVYQDNAGEDAFMQFHVSSDYAVYFGLDGSTNDLAVGGWSMGANKYKIWHQGNDGASSGLDADLLDGLHASSFLRSDNGVVRISTVTSGVSLSVGNGTTHGVYTSDDNRKGVVFGADYYPHVFIVASGSNNTNHGGVLSFVGTEGSSPRQWNMGTSNQNPFLFSIGYNSNADTNPHYGLGDNWSSNDANHARLLIDRSGNVKIRGSLYVNGTKGAIDTGSKVATESWVSSNYQAAGSYAAASHTHDDRYYTETEVDTLLAGKLSTSGKAADAETVDGIDSSRIVYGDGANGRSVSRTDGNANTSDSSNASGFYFGTRVTGMPTTDWWNWVSVRGNSWSGSDGYHFQLAGSFWSDDFRIRRMQSGSNKAWVTLMHSGNIGSQSVNYASSAGSVAWGNITSVPSSFTPSAHTHNYIRAYQEYGSYTRNTDTPLTLKNNIGGAGMRVDFMNGAPFNTWSHVITWSGYDAYNMYQLAGNYGGSGGADPNLYVRTELNHGRSAWSEWKRLWHDGHFSSTQVSNWDTAYGWGNHASAGYLTALPSHNHDDRYYTETESDARYPLSRGSIGTSSTPGDTTGFGNNLAAGTYTRSYTGHSGQVIMSHDTSGSVGNVGIEVTYSGDMWVHTNIDSNSWGTKTIWTSRNFTSTNISNWNTAYGWGNHASAGYLTALPSHNHDDRYYTETEVNTLLAGYASTDTATSGKNGLMSSTDKSKLDGVAANANNYSLPFTDNSTNWNTAYNWGNHASAGYAASSHTHGIGSITDASRWWNNFGANHSTRTSFDAAGGALSTGFGWRYVQGSGNSPGWGNTGNGQYYALTVGLGNDYDYNLYGMQMAIPRNSTTPYLSVRFEENRVLGAWQKISAGYADSAGAVAWGNVSGKPSTFSPSAHTHDDRYYTESEVDTLLAGKQAAGTYLTSLPSHDHSSISGTAQGLAIRGYGSNSLSFQQTSGSFAGYTGWANHFIGNHGDGSNYYNTVHIMPFWGAPKYSRLEGGEFSGLYDYWTSENFDPASKAALAGSSSVTFSASDMNVHAWTRIHGANGIYFQSYGYGLRSPNGEGVTYGNIATYGTGRNGWSGYSVGNWISLMSIDVRRGLFLTDQDRWLIKYDSGEAFSDYDIMMGSDARNKSNVQTLTGSLDKVKALRGVSYNYKNQEKTSLGFIAQEVKQVIPEVVSADSEGYYAIGYQSLIAVLSEAIKEQQTIIDALTARVEALENNR